uniref:Uncharacterized protein n=1 Tax=Schizaphis graminum TaxID=13262 RepID=A0A2S2P1U3_SCHGA
MYPPAAHSPGSLTFYNNIYNIYRCTVYYNICVYKRHARYLCVKLAHTPTHTHYTVCVRYIKYTLVHKKKKNNMFVRAWLAVIVIVVVVVVVVKCDNCSERGHDERLQQQRGLYMSRVMLPI